MLGGCCSFWKRSAEDRGVARARGISVCTGTSGGRRRDCSPVSKRMPSRCFLFSVNVWSAGGFHSRCLKSCELQGMDEVVCVCAPGSSAPVAAAASRVTQLQPDRLYLYMETPSWAGNTLCKSGSIAVFGNVVYSGLLNDHLWHLGVPLFTRLVRAAGPSVHTYLHFVGRVSCSSVEPKQTSGAEFPKVSNGLLLMRALLTCVEVILSIQDVTVVCCGYKTREPLHISASYFISDF
uniref:Uncharacterized protein n=1 Tax=Lates calcarifer TaxID=8187 RepID=A0A4W6CN11_LATCA